MHSILWTWSQVESCNRDALQNPIFVHEKPDNDDDWSLKRWAPSVKCYWCSPRLRNRSTQYSRDGFEGIKYMWYHWCFATEGHPSTEHWDQTLRRRWTKARQRGSRQATKLQKCYSLQCFLRRIREWQGWMIFSTGCSVIHIFISITGSGTIIFQWFCTCPDDCLKYYQGVSQSSFSSRAAQAFFINSNFIWYSESFVLSRYILFRE